MAVKSLKRSSVKSTQKTNAMLAGYNFQDFELIESVFVASTTASVTFNNLNQYATDYKHLQIRSVARSVRDSSLDGIAIRINGDAGNNYSYHRLLTATASGSPISTADIAQTDSLLSAVSAATQTANSFGAIVTDILDAFSSSKNTTIRSLGGFVGTYVNFISGAWFNTASINTLTLLSNNGSSIAAGSRFSLYGIR
jgi:hypothetical protein